MEPPDESQPPAPPRVQKEYEDPHFHDEDPEEGEDRQRKPSLAPVPKKPARRIPPPPRRRFED